MNLMVSPERRVVSRPIEDNRRKNAAAMEIFPIGTILMASDRADGPVYHIHEGCIVHSRLTANGFAQVVDVYGPGRIFVHPSKPSLAEVRIECRYEVLSLRKHARMIHEALVENLDRSHRHVALLCGKTAVQRIATILMDLALQLGADPISRGTLSLPLTRTEIGDWLGLRGETVSRVFSLLIRQRAISLDSPLPPLRQELANAFLHRRWCRPVHWQGDGDLALLWQINRPFTMIGDLGHFHRGARDGGSGCCTGGLAEAVR